MTPAQIEEAQRELRTLKSAEETLASYQLGTFGDEAKRLDREHAGQLMFTSPGRAGTMVAFVVGRESPILKAIERELELRVEDARSACRKAGVTL